MTFELRCLVLAAAGACGAPQDVDEHEGFREIRIHVGFEAASVLAVDLDGDGRPEAIVSGGGDDGSIAVLGLNEDGGLSVLGRYDAGQYPVEAASSDFDDDGRVDLVVANHEANYVTLLFGGPEGFDTGRTRRFIVAVDPHPHAVVTTDVDGDGRMDFLVDDRAPGRFQVYRGAGDGTFLPAEPIEVGGDPYRGLVVADADGDGDLDLVTPNPAAVALTLADGSGRFEAGPRLEAPGLRPFSVAVADVDGDGVPDVAGGSGEGDGQLAVWLGSASGSYRPDPGGPWAIATGPTGLAAGDLDGDGTEDLAVSSYVGNGIAVLFGGSEGRRLARIESEGSPWGLAIADFDGDGRGEILVANNARTYVSWFVSADR